MDLGKAQFSFCNTAAQPMYDMIVSGDATFESAITPGGRQKTHVVWQRTRDAHPCSLFFLWQEARPGNSAHSRTRTAMYLQ